jgi:hypothetical protein
MILNAVVDGQWRHARTSDEVATLLDQLVFAADPRHPSDVVLTEAPFDDLSEEQPLAVCRVAANPDAGFGALLWYLNDADSDFSVSYNPNPPLDDPWLASDPDTARYHDRFTAVPLDQARAALQEFVAGGGTRPSNIQWVAGDFYGRITQVLAPTSSVHAA